MNETQRFHMQRVRKGEVGGAWGQRAVVKERIVRPTQGFVRTRISPDVAFVVTAGTDAVARVCMNGAALTCVGGGKRLPGEHECGQLMGVVEVVGSTGT